MKGIKLRNLLISLVLSTIFLFLYNFSAFSVSCQTIRNDVLRLHIIANSDSKEDQQLKLEVRDAILEKCPDIFSDVSSAAEASDKAENNMIKLKETAEKVISKSGYNYNVNICITNEYFNTRVYDGKTIPAGKYKAIKIIIGEGNGKNWWCVMFPSVCLPAATDKNAVETVFNDNQIDIINNKYKYEIRFRIVEYIEEIKEIINTR